jgi:radical SAM protein with 4Fe4S-binding SPASM domain
MKYILSEQYLLRGWQKLPYGIMDGETKEVRFLEKEPYLFLSRCDGRTEIPEPQDENYRKVVEGFLKDRVIRPAKRTDFLNREQVYRLYPCRYKSNVQWSVTGACNLKCKHCFMSAPEARHGNPSHEELMNIVDQLAECGVFSVGITGGEPLIRPDFWQIVDALMEKGIDINGIYSNGLLVNESFVREYRKRGLHAGVQMSYDGVGMHDWLRGVEGAEEAVRKAFVLLHENGIRADASLCLHRKNAHTIRETVRWLSDNGVRAVKVNQAQQVGEWEKQASDIRLTDAETIRVYAEYIPQFFEDNAPVSLVLDGAFRFDADEHRAYISYIKPCAREDEGEKLSCPSMARGFYIGAEGMVAPCMMMADHPFAERFPNLHETPLREILGDSELMTLSQAKVADVRNGNDECRKCPHLEKCNGGCRQAALFQTGHYYGPERSACTFFKNGWDELIRDALDQPYQDYLERNNLTPGKPDPEEKPVC